MKTLLNLLPEEKKAIIRRGLHVRFLLWQLFLIFLLECFYIGILFGIYFILDFQLKSYQSVDSGIDTAMYSQEKKLSEYEMSFRETNEKTDVIGKIQYFHLYFTQVFILLDALLPEGVVVDTIQTKNYTVLLSGMAKQREDLLSFEHRLKSAACVENVNMPISNLFSQENVDFEMDFSVKMECLRKNK
ncbi:MAG: PilN domain-containing protein [Candidatus Moranbacteria bacterium]|nr:PilN domain-containing protein [Candidatus Moranbacteria bacterium]